MVAAVAQKAVPKYFPDELDLPLDPDHKTWHTERRCPPLLAQALKSERLAMFIAQLHYWLEKENVGVYKEGFHWIYNTEWEWREQFPWWSLDTIGRIRRKLERLGYVVSNDFNRNPFNRTKHSTLDYYRLAVETGWNPMGLDLNRDYPHPPQFTKGMRLRGRHKSDSIPLVYLPVEPDDKETPKPNEIVDSARLQNASCTFDTIHSALLPVSSIYKEIPNTSKSNQETDLKIESEKTSQIAGEVKIFERENSTQSDGDCQKAQAQVTESSSSFQYSAAPYLDGHEQIEATQQLVVGLNTKVEQQEQEPTQHRQLKSKPIRIPDLDEDAHEILWKYQETLLQLNVDLHARRLQSALVSNLQHLEDAIRALIENCANGAKTMEAATGFLYNALLNGWKPRQSSNNASASQQVYTPPPQMLKAPTPPTLEELVERKRTAWHKAIILRPSIEAWVEQTPGVIMTHDGPALAAPTNTPSFLDPEPLKNEHFTLNQSSFTEASNYTAPVVSAPTKLQCHQPPLSDHSDAESLSSAAVSPPTSPSPTAPPTPLTKQLCNGKYQPVEILTGAGEWIAGFFVHSCMVVANLVGQERRFTLFDASGGTYIFFGQIRPQSNT